MLRRAAEGRERGRLMAKVDRIVAPMPGGDHPDVKIENAGKFESVEGDLEGMPGKGRQDTHQAQSRSVSPAQAAYRSPISLPSLPRSASTSHFSNSSCWLCGSKRSDKGRSEEHTTE